MRLVQALLTALVAYAGSAMAYQVVSELRTGRDAWNRHLPVASIVGAIVASAAFLCFVQLTTVVVNPIDVGIAASTIGLLLGYVRA